MTGVDAVIAGFSGRRSETRADGLQLRRRDGRLRRGENRSLQGDHQRRAGHRSARASTAPKAIPGMTVGSTANRGRTPRPPGGKARSPGVAHAKTPFMLIQGEADSTDPLGQSQEMYRALRQVGVQVEMVQYPREDHGPLSRDFSASRVRNLGTASMLGNACSNSSTLRSMSRTRIYVHDPKNDKLPRRCRHAGVGLSRPRQRRLHTASMSPMNARETLTVIDGSGFNVVATVCSRQASPRHSRKPGRKDGVRGGQRQRRSKRRLNSMRMATRYSRERRAATTATTIRALISQRTVLQSVDVAAGKLSGKLQAGSDPRGIRA